MTTDNMIASAQPLLVTGSTWHERKAPAANAFQYSVYFLMLPMRAMSVMRGQTSEQATPCPLPRNQWGLLSFYDSDHGTGDSDALAWVEGVLQDAGIDTSGCEIWLQTFPRVLGYVFKPISIWYLVRKDDSLVAAVVEVNNTFGQRHIYLLSNEGFGWGKSIAATKVFHVSPFCDVTGAYQFRFTKSQLGELGLLDQFRSSDFRIAAYIQNDDLHTHWMGVTQPFSKQSARRAFFYSPLMTLGIVVRIHWQAAKLWWKKVPIYSLPAKPDQFVTRSTPTSTPMPRPQPTEH